MKYFTLPEQNKNQELAEITSHLRDFGPKDSTIAFLLNYSKSTVFKKTKDGVDLKISLN